MSYGLQTAPRKDLGEVLTSISKEQEEQGININFGTVAVEGTATIAPMGYPIIWSTTAANWVPYIAQTISDADANGSDLPTGARVAIVVGDARGAGFNTEDVTLVNAGLDLTVIHRGSAGILNSGIEWDAGSNAAAQAAFLAQMEVQGFTVVPEIADAIVNYIA